MTQNTKDAGASLTDELASMTRMFQATCADLGLINEALGLDPDDGGAEPILDAIAELKAKIAMPATAVPQAVIDALRFYAHGHHYDIDDDHQQFDTVSGEPQNWLFSERDDDCTMIEDGSIAKAVLLGGLPGIDEPTEPLEGEVFSAAPVAPTAEQAEAPSEDAYVARRMTETLAEVYATIIGDDVQQEDNSLNAIERVKKAAQVLRLEVDLYRAQRDETAEQADHIADERKLVEKDRHWNPVYNTDPVQRACGELPFGWEIEILLENGAGCVYLIDPRGQRTDIDSADKFNWTIHDAIEAALADRAAASAGDQA